MRPQSNTGDVIRASGSRVNRRQTHKTYITLRTVRAIITKRAEQTAHSAVSPKHTCFEGIVVDWTGMTTSAVPDTTWRTTMETRKPSESTLRGGTTCACYRRRRGRGHRRRTGGTPTPPRCVKKGRQRGLCSVLRCAVVVLRLSSPFRFCQWYIVYIRERRGVEIRTGVDRNNVKNYSHYLACEVSPPIPLLSSTRTHTHTSDTSVACESIDRVEYFIQPIVL